MRTKILVVSAALVLSANLRAQVTIGSVNAPKAGAILDLNSGAKGGLVLSNVSLDNTGEIPAGFPGMSSAEIAVAKAQLKGAMVYNTNPNTCVGVHAWDGNHWARPISPQKSEGDPLKITSNTANAVGGDNIEFTVDTEAKTYTWYINPNGAGYEYIGVTTGPKLEVAIPAGTVKLKVIADNCHVLEESNEAIIQSESLSPKFGSTDGGNYIYIYGDFPYAATGDYVQSDLVAHYDGVNNSGLGDKYHHNDITKPWANLVDAATPLNVTGTVTTAAWEAKGYRDDNGSELKTPSIVPNTWPDGNEPRTAEIIYTTPPTELPANAEVRLFWYGPFWTSVANDRQGFHIRYRGAYENSFQPLSIWQNSNEIKDAKVKIPAIYEANTLHTVTSTYANSLDDATFTNMLIDGVKVPENFLIRSNAVANTVLDFGYAGSPGGTEIEGTQVSNFLYQSIRLYSRVLSDQEIAHNAALDQIRYIAPPVVTIDGVPCTEVVVLSSHFLMCKVPKSIHGTGYKDVVITTSVKTLTLTGAYQYVEAASAFYVSSISPIIGKANTASQTLILTGNKLDKIADINVGGQPCTNLTVTPDGKTLTCTLPSIDVGEVDIILTMDDATIYRFAKVLEFN
ncbi:MAG: IPT/TIG domain-containing protein [Dysgonamonadaceae bacterium]|jgi:hypothetical protein|nr:IPT/TIG domain-containing protein [Dysgonamonadaceae bacterium]